MLNHYSNKTKPAVIKTALLSKGINFDLDFFKNIDQEFYENQYVYGKTSKKVKKEHKLPQAIKLGEGVICALIRRKESPFVLKTNDSNLALYYKNKFLLNIILPEKPAYFNQKLSDGTKTEDFIAVAGEHIPGFFFYPKCYYFSKGAQCKFCSLMSTRKSVGKHMTSEFSLEKITEATKIFQSVKWKDIPLIFVTTGTFPNNDEGAKYVCEMISAIYSALDPKIPIHLLTVPPDDFNLIEDYKKSGVSTIAFNLEIYNKKLFKEICPGKEKFYSYDKYLQSFDAAREVFGDYRVYCGFVWGLEAPRSTIAGYEYFLKRGISISSNIFHADEGSIFSERKHPTEKLIKKLCKAQMKLYFDYPEARTIFPVSMRSTLDFEIFRGDFK
ncbi:MAG: radical SAM protein [Candidatus Heimdallarchaeaceae archaeon]